MGKGPDGKGPPPPAKGKGPGGPPPPAKGDGKGKSPKAAVATGYTGGEGKPKLSLEEQMARARAKMKKVDVIDKTKRPPDSVKGVKYWLNLPEAAQKLPIVDGGIQLVPHLFECGAKVVLVDFFAYSCTNCLRVVPVLRRWHAMYGPHGLVILSFHRPEFDFERDAINMRSFISRESVNYIVGLDNDDAAWTDWEVTMWPSSFMVVRDNEATESTASSGDEQFKIIKEHYGDRNHHELEALIRARTIGPGTVDEYNNLFYADAEFFLGKQHRFKNVDSTEKEPGCGEGACKIKSQDKAAAGATVPRPGEGHTVYGAGWCTYCQRTKMLLDTLSMAYDYVDVDSVGGAAHTLKVLKQTAELPEAHGTIPVIYNGGVFVGGMSEFVHVLREERAESVDSALEEISSNVTSTIAEFNKFNHQLSASLKGGRTMEDFYLAQENAEVVLNIAMSSKADVNVFVVASYQDEEVQSSRELAYSSVTSMASIEDGGFVDFSGATLVGGDDFTSLFANSSSAEQPSFAVIIDEQEVRNVPLKYPGRVLLATARADSSNLVTSRIVVRPMKNIKLYTFFLTSEPLGST